MRRVAALAAGMWLAFGLAGCDRKPPRPRPILVLAVDGAEWSVIEELWGRGELPNLKRLAERGVSGELKTGYDSKSPVIWTTIATGVRPERHGITDFVLPSETGDVPASSSVRRVPAIWNMLSAAGRRTAVLGWWASWPSEAIEGVVLSDRAARGLAEGAAPFAWWTTVREQLDELLVEDDDLFPPGLARDQDTLVRRVALRLDDRTLAGAPFDLRLVYLRSVDTMSHAYWRYFRPGRYPELPAEELAEFADRVPRAYVAVDRVLGELARAEENVIVLSDHGFYGMRRERRRLVCPFDAVLAELGFLRRRKGRIDVEATRLMTHASPAARPVKRLRRPPSGERADAELAALRAELERELGRIVYADGAPLFALRDPSDAERSEGAEIVVTVLEPSADSAVEPTVLFDGEARPDLLHVERLSGSHGGATHGIFIAAGPDIDPSADLDGIRIHDVTPTLLYGLGVPVAEDFDGRTWKPLFTAEFRERFPLQKISSWGTRDAGDAAESEIDEQLKEELRALGYL